ncbi:MAG: hypothetical protein ACI9QD_000655 [Thermoproteota archaeon]|jgi:hypothetical protein
MKKEVTRSLIITFFLLVLAYDASAKKVLGPTRVGNGADGSDLEGFERVSSGKLIKTKEQALKLLAALNLKAIPGLSALDKELSLSVIYQTKKDVSSERLEEMGAYHSGMEGKVYARTFARPHAPTRFFPISQNLNDKQLVSLHIHEALHRSLPPEVRENEKIVTAFTLSIAGPESSFDTVQSIAQKYIPPRYFKVANSKASNLIEEWYPPVAEHSRLNAPSTFGFSYVKFGEPGEEESKTFSVPVDSMFQVSSHLYPFGGKFKAIGVGIDLAVLKYEEETEMGPLGLSFRHLMWTYREFDFEGFFKANLNTLSEDELKDSVIGRDNHTVGISMHKRGKRFYLQNNIEYTFATTEESKIGNIDMTYDFGSQLNVHMKFGTYFGKIQVGGFFEVLLMNDFDAYGGGLAKGDAALGTNRIISMGPEISWVGKDFSIDLYGRFQIDATKDMDYDLLGDIMGKGLGQSNVGIKLSIKL